MKKWLLILIAIFTLTGCSGNTENVTSQSPDKETVSETGTTDEETVSETETPDKETVSETGTTDEETSNDTEKLIQQDTMHEYFCDKFMLTVDDKQFDLTTIDPVISSVSELYPITDDQLYILGRVDENYNSLMVYDFTKEEFIFAEHGSTMCWVQNKFETARYLKDNVVYDFAGNIIYQPEETKLISMIEYVVEDFKVTITDLNYENPEEIWVE